MRNIQHKYADVHGIRLHYATAGSGPLLLLLHGFPEFWYSWHSQLTHFSTHFKVVAPDLRGYNESDKPNWGYEVDVLMADILALIDVLGYEHAIIAGHDWGGMLAWSLAICYPHRIQRLIVLNAPHPAILAKAIAQDWIHRLNMVTFALFRIPWLPETILSCQDYAIIAWMLRGLAVNKQAFSDDDIEAYKDAISKPGALQSALNWYRHSCLFPSLWQTHPVVTFFHGKPTNVTIPTLLIWGEKDHDRDMPLTQGTEQYVSDLHIIYLAASSHRVLQEKTTLVNRFIKEFLAYENTL